MIGELIKEIANPTEEGEFAFIKVESGNYELRFGGILKGKPEISNKCKPIENPFIGRNIESAYTDEESVYVFVEGNGLITHGSLNVSGDGEFSFAIFFNEGDEVIESKKEFENRILTNEEFTHELTIEKITNES